MGHPVYVKREDRSKEAMYPSPRYELPLNDDKSGPPRKSRFRIGFLNPKEVSKLSFNIKKCPIEEKEFNLGP